MSIFDYEVVDDHLEVERGSSEIDHEVAGDASHDMDTTVWIWRSIGVLTSWICYLSLSLGFEQRR